MLDRASQAAVHCNRVQVRPSGKIEVALWSSSAMASLASGLDQWGYRAGVRNVRGITSTGAGIVLGTLLDPLADQGDLGSGQRCLWRSWHDLVRIIIVDGLPEVSILNDPALHQGGIAGDLDMVIIAGGRVVATGHRAVGDQQGKDLLFEIDNARVAGVHRFGIRSSSSPRPLSAWVHRIDQGFMLAGGNGKNNTSGEGQK